MLSDKEHKSDSSQLVKKNVNVILGWAITASTGEWKVIVRKWRKLWRGPWTKLKNLFAAPRIRAKYKIRITKFGNKLAVHILQPTKKHYKTSIPISVHMKLVMWRMQGFHNPNQVYTEDIFQVRLKRSLWQEVLQYQLCQKHCNTKFDFQDNIETCNVPND